jgi:hypothetical protein
MKYFFLMFFLIACDTEIEDKKVCKRHEVLCNNECIFIDDIILYNKECIKIK